MRNLKPPRHIPTLQCLTTSRGVGIITNMNAELMLNERHVVSEDAFVEMVVWRLPSPATGSQHGFKGLSVNRHFRDRAGF